MYFHLNQIQDLIRRARAEETRVTLRKSLESYLGLDVVTRECRAKLLKNLPMLSPLYVFRIAPHFGDETPPEYPVWRKITEEIGAKRAYVFEEKTVPLEHRIRAWLVPEFDPHEVSGFYIRTADRFRAEKLCGMHTGSLHYAEARIKVEQQICQQYEEGACFLEILEDEAGRDRRTLQRELLFKEIGRAINHLCHEKDATTKCISSLTSDLSRYKAQVQQARARGTSLHINLSPTQRKYAMPAKPGAP
jgi:hypothetical protein